jgi:hypothetical protein
MKSKKQRVISYNEGGATHNSQAQNMVPKFENEETKDNTREYSPIEVNYEEPSSYFTDKEDQSVEYSLLDKNLENTFSTYHNMLQKTKTRQLDEASEYSAMDKNINQKLKNFIYNKKQ